MIKLENITVQIASKILLENASAQIADGQKIGIVGHNGCGKTTLFKVLKGEHDVNAGEVFLFPKPLQSFCRTGNKRRRPAKADSGIRSRQRQETGGTAAAGAECPAGRPAGNYGTSVAD